MDPEFDWLALDDDEEVVWSATPHPYSLVPAIVVGLPLTVVLVGIVILVGAYLSHKNTNYVVTSDALYKKTGVLSRSVQRIEFGKVQDTSYRQSFLGARYGYGTVDVSTAGGGGVEMSFGNVPEPRRVQSLINERLRGVRDRGDDEAGDPNEVLAEILTELRAIRAAVGGEGAERTAANGDEEDGNVAKSASEATSVDAVDDPTGRRDVVEAGDTGRNELDRGDDGGDEPADGDERRAGGKGDRAGIRFEDGS